MAQFKQEHAKELPEFSQFTFSTLERSETERVNVQRVLMHCRSGEFFKR